MNSRQRARSWTPAGERRQLNDLKCRRAEAAVEMARYYEDARRLAYMFTQWAMTLKRRQRRFVVTSGGGPGIMEAANRGAYEAGGKTIGLNIKLPFEQVPNPYITPALNFEFHYFFMRKYWFAYLAKALVVFPGGFGTLDEDVRNPHPYADRKAGQEDHGHLLRFVLLESGHEPGCTHGKGNNLAPRPRALPVRRHAGGCFLVATGWFNQESSGAGEPPRAAFGRNASPGDPRRPRA